MLTETIKDEMNILSANSNSQGTERNYLWFSNSIILLLSRVSVPDTRVHACLYFIAPTGHGLKPLDIEFMRRIHDKVTYQYNTVLDRIVSHCTKMWGIHSKVDSNIVSSVIGKFISHMVRCWFGLK